MKTYEYRLLEQKLEKLEQRVQNVVKLEIRAKNIRGHNIQY